MTLVSVVVPVHNAENHLKECLTSIQNQTLTDIEIILINDASTDATPQILAEFASEEPRATILQGPGCGSAGAARNLGMARAAGEYLAFFDADDFFLPTMLEELYAKAAADHADVVACKFRIYNDVTRGDATQLDASTRATSRGAAIRGGDGRRPHLLRIQPGRVEQAVPHGVRPEPRTAVSGTSPDE